MDSGLFVGTSMEMTITFLNGKNGFELDGMRCSHSSFVVMVGCLFQHSRDVRVLIVFESLLSLQPGSVHFRYMTCLRIIPFCLQILICPWMEPYILGGQCLVKFLGVLLTLRLGVQNCISFLLSWLPRIQLNTCKHWVKSMRQF